MEEKKKRNPFLLLFIITVPILLLVIAILSVICLNLFLAKTNAERKAGEYRAELSQIEEKKQSAEDYQAEYKRIALSMLDDAVLAEKCGNLTVQVWNNVIFSKNDPETDPYTMENGKFVSDFNIALRNLFRDSAFSADIAKLTANRQQIKYDMKEMVNPPEGYEDEYQALEDMYDSYLSFTDIVINCDGSLESFSADFGNADTELSKKYNTVELYLK